MSWLTNLFRKKSIQVEGTYEKNYSLSIVNTTTALALEKYTKYDIKIDATKYHQAYMSECKDVDEKILKLSKKKIKNVDISIRNIYPPHTKDMTSKIKIIGPYGWEESKIPQEYIQWFNKDLTQVFTMSNYVKRVLINNGLTIPVTVTGIVADELLYIKSKSFDFDFPKGFNLLHISSAFPRKGVEELLKAFDLLDGIDNLSLIIKTFPNPHNNVKQLLNDFDFLKVKVYEDGIELFEKDAKKILLIDKDISKEKIKYLYENSNILVSPTKGEGFGLPMAEAMLMNIPVITTKYGGQSDFCTDDTSWLCDFDFEYTNTHMNQKNSVWQVAKVESIVEQIKQIYNLNPIQIQKKTKEAKKFILENYSSKKIAQNIEEAINNNFFESEVNLAIYSKMNSIEIYKKYNQNSFDDKVSIENYSLDLEALLLENRITHLIIEDKENKITIDRLEKLISFCTKHNIRVFLFWYRVNNISKSFQLLSQIFVFSLEEMNILKEFEIYRNTLLLDNIDNLELSNKNMIKEYLSKIKYLVELD